MTGPALLEGFMTVSLSSLSRRLVGVGYLHAPDSAVVLVVIPVHIFSVPHLHNAIMEQRRLDLGHDYNINRISIFVLSRHGEGDPWVVQGGVPPPARDGAGDPRFLSPVATILDGGDHRAEDRCYHPTRFRPRVQEGVGGPGEEGGEGDRRCVGGGAQDDGQVTGRAHWVGHDFWWAGNIRTVVVPGRLCIKLFVEHKVFDHLQRKMQQVKKKR